MMYEVRCEMKGGPREEACGFQIDDDGARNLMRLLV